KKEQPLFKKLIHLIGYVTLPFLIITQLPYLNGNYSPFLLLSIFIMIWCNDTFAYICGRLLGKHKLYEKISPKKTIEGFIGGLLFRSEEYTSELQSRENLVCRLLLEKKKNIK